MKKMYKLIIITIIISPIVNLYSFPGDNMEGYTCNTFRRTDCTKEITFNFSNPINKTCGPQIHDQSSYFAMFGDSLTELADFYGVWGFNAYFNFLGNNINVQNFGISAIPSQELRYNVGAVSPEDTGFDMNKYNLRNLYRCLPLGSHPTGIGSAGWTAAEVPAKSSSRSVLMIGGNDIFYSGINMVLFPFLKSHYMENVTNNIRQTIDWNLENGKSVLLLGTIPPDSRGLYDYDTFYVNRNSLCNGIPSPIPESWPTWIVFLIPGATELIAQYYINGINAFVDFTSKIHTDMLRGILINASISQACLNDKLKFEVLPAYHSDPDYVNRVKMLPLYDFFAENAGDVTTKNFWVPHRSAYLQIHQLKEVFESPLPGDITIFDLFSRINSQILQPVDSNDLSVPLPNNINIPILNEYFRDVVEFSNVLEVYNHYAKTLRKVNNAIEYFFDEIYKGHFHGTEYKSAYNPYIPRKSVYDPVHVGPIGYLQWTNLMKGFLVANGGEWLTTIDQSGIDPIDGKIIYAANQKIREKSIQLQTKDPTSPSLPKTSVTGVKGRCQEHVGPDPAWKLTTGIYLYSDMTICYKSGSDPDEAFETHGAIRTHYLNKGGQAWIGFPTSDEKIVGPLGANRRSNFECGHMIWAPFFGIEVVSNDSCPGFVP